MATLAALSAVPHIGISMLKPVLRRRNTQVVRAGRHAQRRREAAEKKERRRILHLRRGQRTRVVE